MIASRLTPHQADVLCDVARRWEASETFRSTGIPIDWIGSRGALEHLEEKGRVQIVRATYGRRSVHDRVILLDDTGAKRRPRRTGTAR
jgi:hypothetical protein